MAVGEPLKLAGMSVPDRDSDLQWFGCGLIANDCQWLVFLGF